MSKESVLGIKNKNKYGKDAVIVNDIPKDVVLMLAFVAVVVCIGILVGFTIALN